MNNIVILWVDDEIDLLKPHIIFLEQKNYKVDTASNGNDAIDLVSKFAYDIILLDENMPGISGLETLTKIKSINSTVPVVMITKSEEENIMDNAIGSKINDYLIKPVNPNQILLTIKKNVDHKRLISEKTTKAYQSAFTRLGMEINDSLSHKDWIEVYKKLVYWELELAESENDTMDEVLKLQKHEANNAFAKFVKRNYTQWFELNNTDKPLLSPNLLRDKVFPLLKDNKKVFFLLIDNMRFDQWKIISNELAEYYRIEEEGLYYSILPTATQYSRNAIFSGLMPSEIDKMYPELWKNDDEEGGKNLYEEEMLRNLLKRYNLDKGLFFEKVLDVNFCKKITDKMHEVLHNNLSVVIVNFVDTLSHARTDQKMIRELTGDETAYRSITKSWFKHSAVLDMLKELSRHDVHLVISTDHGAIQVQNPIKVVGDRNTTTNLRYKQGRNLNYNKKEVFEVTRPQDAHLPKTNISSTYIFSQNNDFFAYPNNYNHYVKYYRETFQHGGISLEEMVIPIITLKPKK
jgi:DNA-binding response OmpR family regulator